jgi:hypothetical protein
VYHNTEDVNEKIQICVCARNELKVFFIVKKGVHNYKAYQIEEKVLNFFFKLVQNGGYIKPVKYQSLYFFFSTFALNFIQQSLSLLDK